MLKRYYAVSSTRRLGSKIGIIMTLYILCLLINDKCVWHIAYLKQSFGILYRILQFGQTNSGEQNFNLNIDN